MRGVKAGRHVTGVYATNAEGEVLPSFYIFDSTAKADDNFRVTIDWFVVFHRLRRGLTVQLVSIPTASMQFAREDP